jgi:hypothetical protein
MLRSLSSAPNVIYKRYWLKGMVQDKDNIIEYFKRRYEIVHGKRKKITKGRAITILLSIIEETYHSDNPESEEVYPICKEYVDSLPDN